MEVLEITIRLYEILNRENKEETIIGKSEGADWDEGLETGSRMESAYFEKEIKKLIKEIKGSK